MTESPLTPFMADTYRADFPILKQTIHGKPLVYLDNGATTQKPRVVIDQLTQFYQNDYANVHRGVYELSVRASRAYEASRERVRQWINASASEEIIFTSGATSAINLVAQTYARSHLKENDEIIVSGMEHHSNLVPWQMIAKERGARLRIIPVTDQGELALEAYESLFNAHTKLVAVTHASNVLGTLNPIQTITRIAHEQGVPVLVDGAAAFPHMKIDVHALGCDFYVFSAHKAYGPTGVGVLYGKKELLEKMPPYQGGGDMIEQVSLDDFKPNRLPFKFEAGTPNIAGVIGLSSALQYLQSIGMQAIHAHEQALLKYATQALSTMNKIRIIGNAEHKVGVISFVLDNVHAHDIATVLDHEGIAVRAGHHCAMPLMERFNVPATVRVSLGLYNTKEDIDRLIAALTVVERMFT